MNLDYKSLIQGELVKCFVRIKPAINFQREDLRLNQNNLIITDQNNRILQEFEVPEAFGTKETVISIFENFLSDYTGPLLQGLNVQLLAIGSTGAGKTLTLEGNIKEQGMIMLYGSTIFQLLENKKARANSDENSLITNYEYSIMIQFVEIIDEKIKDLFKSNKAQIEELHVVDDPWQGPVIQNARWIQIQDANELNQLLQNGIKQRQNISNEFGKISAKSTGVFQLRLIQTSIMKATSEPLILQSQMVCYDLPGTEILIEDPETVRIKQGNTLNKAIISFSNLIKDLSQDNQDYAGFEQCTVTQLMKEQLGSNSLIAALFFVQQGDQKGSNVTLSMMQQLRKISTYPMINDGKSLSIMHRFRQESVSAKSGRVVESISKQGDGASIQKALNMEREQQDIRQQIVELVDERVVLGGKIAELRQKYQDMVKQKAALQSELIKSEEEKLDVAKALVDMEMENTRLMDIIQNEKFNQQSKLLNGGGDVLQLNIREEKALQTIQELQDRMKELLDEKREIELEFMILKKNYMQNLQELETERMKQETYGLQLINITNENKVLQQQLNDSYKMAGSQTEQGQKLVERLEVLERENREKSEAEIFMKAQIERLQTQLLGKYIKDKQGQIQNEMNEVNIERSMLLPQTSKHKIGDDGDDKFLQRQRDDKMLWESQKMELTHKVRSLQRRINDDNERLKDLEKQNQELLGENARAQIQVDEMRSVYRNKLLQIQNKDQQQIQSELQREYQDREQQLTFENSRQKQSLEQQKQDIKALRAYARNLKYIAEDWAPLTSEMPDILTKEPPIMVDLNEEVSSLTMSQKDEIERLKTKNKRLEEQLKLNIQNQNNNNNNDYSSNINLNGIDTNSRLMNELGKLNLENKQRPNSRSYEFESVRKERNDLQEENKKLVQFLKDSKKWDTLMIQKENERLMNLVRDYEKNSIGPVSQNQSSKFAFYEKMVKQAEKEKTELLVRATMAEEQLNALQASLTRITQNYQKKINELKMQIKGI